MTNKRKRLAEEINRLNERIRELHSYNEDCSAEMQELIKLIIELDNLEQDKEIEEYKDN